MKTGCMEGEGIEIETTVLPFTITIITIYCSAHNKQIITTSIVTQSTTFQF